ncbi:MAG: HlyD family secretion protein [Planctomycetota bacterium]
MSVLSSSPPPALAPQVPALRAARTPRAIWRLTRALLLLLLALPCALLAAPWQQNVRGEGHVSAYAPLERRQAVEAPIDGRIVRWWVVEGSEVAAGDPLFEITDNDPRLLERLRDQLEAARAKLAASQAKVHNYDGLISAYGDAQRLALEAAAQRVAMAEQSVAATTRAVEAADVAHLTAGLNFERREELRRDGLASQRDWELARLEVRRASAELERQRAALRAAESDKAAKVADLGKTRAEFDAKVRSARADREGAASDAASARATVLDLEVKLARQETQRATAPAAGTVYRLMANAGGEMVKAGDPVVVIVPQTESMAVELWVDGNDMPLVSAGRKVRVQFEGWPAVQFAGWPSVAVGTFGGVVRLVDATDDGRGKFRVLVGPDPQDQAWPSRRFLRQGVQARGWVLLEQVSLGFELWRQINGFPPVIADVEPGSSRGAAKPQAKGTPTRGPK